MKSRYTILIALLTFAFFQSNTANSQVKKCIGSDGKTHYGDYCPTGANRVPVNGTVSVLEGYSDANRGNVIAHQEKMNAGPTLTGVGDSGRRTEFTTKSDWEKAKEDKIRRQEEYKNAPTVRIRF
jgi:hypothetical protein